MSQHVRVKGHFLIEGHKLVNPGSVVILEDDMAKQFVKRGLGEAHPGPVHHAAAEEDGIAEKSPAAPERHDLGSRIAKAERAVAGPQAKQAGAL